MRSRCGLRKNGDLERKDDNCVRFRLVSDTAVLCKPGAARGSESEKASYCPEQDGPCQPQHDARELLSP